MQILSGRRNIVWELAFSHCGRWLAAGGYVTGGLQVWDTANPTAKPRQPDLGKYAGAGTLAFRPDGRIFFQSSNDRWYLYDPAGDTLTELQSPRPRYIVSSPDGQRVLRVWADYPLCSWNVPAEGKAEAELKRNGGKAFIKTGVYSADSTLLATADDRRKQVNGRAIVSHFLAVRDTESGEIRREWKSVYTNSAQLCFTQDTSHLIARSAGYLACWNLADLHQPPSKAANPRRRHFLRMAVHPNGLLLTVDNDRLVRVWNVPSLTVDRTIQWNIGKLYAVAVSPDGTRAAVGSHTGKVLVWDWD